MDIPSQIRSSVIEKKLQGLWGNGFEEHARFILKIVNPHYFTFTRQSKDKKIDGYAFRRVAGEKRPLFDIYSVYGKKATTSPSGNGVIKKINDDLNDAIEYAKERNFNFIKWNLVINFELENDYRHELENKCAEHGIGFEELNPTVLVTKLIGEDKLFEAACFFDAVDAPKLDYSEHSNYKLARVALQDIAKNVTSLTDKQFELLKDIMGTILKVCFLDEKNQMHYYRYAVIAKGTRIPEDKIYAYKFVEGNLLRCDYNDKKFSMYKYFSLDENDNVIIHVSNLYPIYLLCVKLYIQLEETGTYSLTKGLEECFRYPLAGRRRSNLG